MGGVKKRRLRLEKELAELQAALATIDFYEAMAAPQSRDRMYLILKVLEPIKIRMDGNKNHKRPHLHVDYGKEIHAASYAIKPAKRLVGELRRKYDDKICEWITAHQEELLRAWDVMQAGGDAKPLAYELMRS